MDNYPSRPLPAERDAEARGLEIVLVPRGEGAFDEIAAGQGITVEDGVKTMVVKTSGSATAFVLIPGTRRLDWVKLRSLAAVNKATLVKPEAALEITGYEPGTITPLGSSTVLPVFADDRVRGRRIGMGSGSSEFLLFTDADPLLASLGATLGDITS
jgi:Cys-tRNA(Pro)/Cys-tRNA(Cys) deacylase